jgi:hypothetical protein
MPPVHQDTQTETPYAPLQVGRDADSEDPSDIFGAFRALHNAIPIAITLVIPISLAA